MGNRTPVLFGGGEVVGRKGKSGVKEVQVRQVFRQTTVPNISLSTGFKHHIQEKRGKSELPSGGLRACDPEVKGKPPHVPFSLPGLDAFRDAREAGKEKWNDPLHHPTGGFL